MEERKMPPVIFKREHVVHCCTRNVAGIAAKIKLRFPCMHSPLIANFFTWRKLFHSEQVTELNVLVEEPPVKKVTPHIHLLSHM